MDRWTSGGRTNLLMRATSHQSPALGVHTHAHAHGFRVGMGGYCIQVGTEPMSDQYCLRHEHEHVCHVNTSSLIIIVFCMF